MKVKLEVPVTAFFIVEVEAESEEDALDQKIKVPTLCLHCAPKLYFSVDNIEHDKIEVYK